MQGKELVRDMINTYFMLVTMILAVMMVLGTQFMPEVVFGYEGFSAPLKYAFFATLPNLVMYAKKELTVKQFLFRKIIQLLLVEGIVISIAVPAESVEVGQTGMVVLLAISIFAVYLITHLIDWFQNSVNAKSLTRDLVAFQQSKE